MQFNSEINGVEMGELHTVADDQLLVSLENHFAQERKLTRVILFHLKEIHARRLYAKRGYPNMFWMLIKHFKQSETAANQRMKALELMLAVPVVEERIVSGDLNLSTLALAQRQIAREEKVTNKKLSKEEKAEIVDSITSKTMADAEIELFKHLPESASTPQTVVRRISEEGVRMGLTMPNSVHARMTRLQELWAHVDRTMDPIDIIDRAFEIALDKVDPLRRKPKPTKDKLRKATATTQSFADSAKHRVSGQLAGKRATYYKKELDRELWQRAGGQCEWVDPSSGKRCDCSFGVQREHVIPVALGGSNDLSNLQLLCSTHNLLRARQVFGDKKIDYFQNLRE